MKAAYYPQDDILGLSLSDKKIVREMAQDWNIAISYAEDGSVVEIVILDAVAAGLMPFRAETAPVCQVA